MRDLHEDPNDVSMIKIDLAHTHSIAGWGKDELASTLIFVAVRCALFGPGTMETQLEEAFGSFKEWCAANHKCTSITEFSKSELKITSFLVRAIMLRAFLRGFSVSRAAWARAVMRASSALG